MEQREFKKCFYLQRNVCLIHEIKMDMDEFRNIKSRVESRCNDANHCDQQKIMCKWVSADHCFDGIHPKNLPSPYESPRNN